MDAPVKGEVIYDFGRGVVLRAPMPGNYEWVQANLREGDQKEFDDAKADYPDETTYPRGVIQAAIWINDELAAYWDSLLMPGYNGLHHVRAWAFYTTDVVERNKIKFARMSRIVYDFLWMLEPIWVTHAYVCPWDGYKRCLNWQAKYFGAQEICEFVINGEPYHGYLLPRTEVKEVE